MHHPTQYQFQANVRQQERLQQAAAHRAVKEAGQGSGRSLGWLLWPIRMVVAGRLLPRPGRLAPGATPSLNEAGVSPNRN